MNINYLNNKIVENYNNFNGFFYYITNNLIMEYLFLYTL